MLHLYIIDQFNGSSATTTFIHTKITKISKLLDRDHDRKSLRYPKVNVGNQVEEDRMKSEVPVLAQSNGYPQKAGKNSITMAGIWNSIMGKQKESYITAPPNQTEYEYE